MQVQRRQYVEPEAIGQSRRHDVLVLAFPFLGILALQAYVPGASLQRKALGSEECQGIHIVNLEPIAALFLVDSRQ